MIMKDQIAIGDKVHYISPNGKIENGIVKDLDCDPLTVRVVYYCNLEWDNYMNYTSQLTYLANLHLGWNTNAVNM